MNRGRATPLAAIAVTLIGVLVAEARLGSLSPMPSFVGTEQPRSRDVPAPASTGRSPTAASWTATILARPLFYPNRRPTNAVRSAGAMEAELPRLSGVLVSTAGRSAIFAGPAAAQPILVQVGDRIAGYTVRAIAAGAVMVDGPGGVKVLHPTFALAVPGAGATAVGKAGRPLTAPDTRASETHPTILQRLETDQAPTVPMPPPPTLQSLVRRIQTKP